jgi:hypothetical protein
MSTNTAIAAGGWLFSLLVATVSGLLAYKASLNRFREEMQAQEEAKIVELSGKYLTPLGYWGEALSRRLGEIEDKFRRQDEIDEDKESRSARVFGRTSMTRKQQTKAWFEQIRLQVNPERERREDLILSEPDFQSWCYYEGIFAVSTLYYTCSYFYCARELRFFRPFGEVRPRYSQELDARLNRVTKAFHWSADDGIYPESQEVIGERFRRDGTKMTYAEMCNEHTAKELYRRAVFFRTLDVFCDQLDEKSLPHIKEALDGLLRLLSIPDVPVNADYGEAERREGRHRWRVARPNRRPEDATGATGVSAT